MKVPRFEAQAQRWGDDARFVFLFSREAHPEGKGGAELGRELERLLASDKDGDGRVTQAEYNGSPSFFGACDLDRDGEVLSHETLAIRRIDEFSAVNAPATLDDRRALARRFRAEVPGRIPVLLDTSDNATTKAYGATSNSAYVLDSSCRVAIKQQWAAEAGIEHTLGELTGKVTAEIEEPDVDWSPLNADLRAAKEQGRPLLLHLSAQGCGACTRVETELTKPEVAALLEAFVVTRREISDDAIWAIFEALQLGATPALVVVDPATHSVKRISQGYRSADELLAFLRG